MDLNGSKTLQNLARAFAGESQARTRYDFYRETAEQDGYYAIAMIIREISRNELAHAKVFFDHILSGGLPSGHLKNIVNRRRLPLPKRDDCRHLLFSMQAEQEENTTIYRILPDSKQEAFWPSHHRLK